MLDSFSGEFTKFFLFLISHKGNSELWCEWESFFFPSVSQALLFSALNLEMVTVSDSDQGSLKDNCLDITQGSSPITSLLAWAFSFQAIKIIPSVIWLPRNTATAENTNQWRWSNRVLNKIDSQTYLEKGNIWELLPLGHVELWRQRHHLHCVEK